VRAVFSLRALRHDLPAAEESPHKQQGGETKQACRAKAKRRTGSYSRTTPCTRRVEKHDTLPYAVGRRPLLLARLERHKRHSAYAAGWQRYVLRHHFVTPRIIGGVVCRSTRAHYYVVVATCEVEGKFHCGRIARESM
jgi:hypothetical protein